jgi:hypothetical protein
MPSGGPQVPHTGGAAGERAVALTPAPVLKAFWVPSARSNLLYCTQAAAAVRARQGAADAARRRVGRRAAAAGAGGAAMPADQQQDGGGLAGGRP